MSELLKEFPGCLPSQLLAEDSDTLYSVVNTRRYTRAFARVTSEELTEADLDEWEIDLVTPNVERMINGHRG